ncbi:MAG: ATP-dependent metallopeptidase FtsH/Yme1/Tma family protein, partial [Pseudomonadota bacterium]
MNSNFRYLAIYAIILVLLIGLFNFFRGPTDGRAGSEISYSEFLGAVENKSVDEVLIQGRRLTGTYRSNGK